MIPRRGYEYQPRVAGYSRRTLGNGVIEDPTPGTIPIRELTPRGSPGLTWDTVMMRDSICHSTLRLTEVLLVWSVFTATIASAQDLGIPARARAITGDFHRAGNPQCIARWARPSYERHGGSYYVGGGRTVGGEGRYVHEGTWGNDYTPWYTRVGLRWNHGRNYQGGEGQYEPDRYNRPLGLGPPR